MQHLNRAFGSLREVGYQLEVAHRLGYLAEEQRMELNDPYDRAARVLDGLIRSLADDAR